MVNQNNNLSNRQSDQESLSQDNLSKEPESRKDDQVLASLAPQTASPKQEKQIEDIFEKTEANVVKQDEQVNQEREKTTSDATLPSLDSSGRADKGQNKGKMVVVVAMIIVIVFIIAAGVWYYLSSSSADSIKTNVQLNANININTNTNANTDINVNNNNNNIDAQPAKQPDFDSDGLTDEDEEMYGTDPKSADSDQDTLLDYEEIKIYKTNPLNSDTDGDGYLDGEEVRSGYNPLGEGRLQ